VGVIRNANFTKDCKLDYTNIAYLDVEEKQYEKRKLQCGDIIVEKSGGSDNQPVGRTILFERKDGDYSFSNFTAVLRIIDGYPALPEYLNMYLQAVYQTGITKSMQTQTTGIHNLIFDQFLAIPILVPPITEQYRIVDKVNELFQILDSISAEL
jgi:type I restriction enzyme S subunit